MSAFEILPKVAPLESADLCEIFNQTFYHDYQTHLVGGGEEPIYRVAGAESEIHTIVFSHDYAASALHEVAHWCVAGPQRRQLEDYGYWYAPDGRTEQQQAEFEKVEVRPQAFEWIFSVAAGRRFRVSADNLEAGLGASDDFKDAIHAQVLQFCRNGLPSRANQFTQALAAISGCSDPLSRSHYLRSDLE